MTESYDINLDIAYEHQAHIDVGAIAAACEKTWWNQTLTKVNESVVRLGVLHGEFHWHKHDEEDEFFMVLEGRLLIDIEGDDTVELGPQQGVTISKGVMHRPRAPERTVVVMIESASVKPTGD
jgi:mannose-6-phosphate isomerase-like protein (cupin superfamily)